AALGWTLPLYDDGVRPRVVCAASIGPSLPQYASLLMTEFGAQQKIRKEGKSCRRQGGCLPGEMCPANSIQEKTVHRDGQKSRRQSWPDMTVQLGGNGRGGAAGNQHKLRQPQQG